MDMDMDMDGEAEPNLPPQPLTTTIPNLTSSSSSSTSSSSSDGFIRSFQAAFKRHRSLGSASSMRPVSMLPRRCVPPLKHQHPSSATTSKLQDTTTTTTTTTSLHADVDPASKPNSCDAHSTHPASVHAQSQEVATLSPPSFSGSITNSYPNNSNYNPHIMDQDHQPASNCNKVNINVDSKNCPLPEGSKKVKFSLASSIIPQGAHGSMATALNFNNLSSHMDSLALTELEWDAVNQADSANIVSNKLKQYNSANSDTHGVLRADGGSSAPGVRMSSHQNQLHHFRDFLLDDVNHPMTQSSVAGSSCATTISVHATSAPILNSTTHPSCPHQDSSAVRSLADANMKSHNMALGDGVQQQVYPPFVSGSRADADRVHSGAQASSSAAYASVELKDIQHRNFIPQCQAEMNLYQTQGDSVKEKERGTDASNIPPSCPISKDLSSAAKLDPAISDKQAKAPPRKKGYDPDLFFKVNGKLYQRLGKIGSGGSSEVHKVISSDCTIYALKKIKLKGRDYATAYGFCQEILYLKKLKGKNNIIQLIDFEVTDKALLHAVMNDLISNKENRVKDDGYIYMVLEYGEIDLAHMLSQKWKEIDASNSTMDENWLRFYWRQILQAVNTIHEERIVHSDLKPANFLLVKGSLKLIDFGIAKAIMSDTTNIQRDSQVGTLSYMSPEAFMCNESDANGNTIKCGRPSDIWSLGCILYQMVYGRTPFSEYKTFWAKFKVITDPNHEITYGPVSNPWLMDLMKKCLAWDRNERWRIPQLLEHPFLVPPIQQHCKFMQLITETYPNDEIVSNLCTKFEKILGLRDSAAASQIQQTLSICQQLQEHIMKIS